MKNTRRIIALLMTALFCLSGMALAESVRPDADRAGNAIALPGEVNTIVSLAPSTTEIIIDLGLADKLVAIDTYSAFYWPELAELPQYDMMAPDNEQLALLKPDIVFVTGMSYAEGENPFAALISLGVCVAEIPSSTSIAGIRDDVQFIADCLGVSDAGAALVSDMDATLAEVKTIGDAIAEKKTVMFEISALPYLYSFGQGTYLNELIELIGAVNVLGDQEGWISVTEESALAMNPDVILTSVDYIEDPVGEILSREGWDDVTAVKNEAVYAIDAKTSNLPNTHIVEALIEMALAVYPQEYAAFAGNN